MSGLSGNIPNNSDRYKRIEKKANISVNEFILPKWDDRRWRWIWLAMNLFRITICSISRVFNLGSDVRSRSCHDYCIIHRSNRRDNAASQSALRTSTTNRCLWWFSDDRSVKSYVSTRFVICSELLLRVSCPLNNMANILFWILKSASVMYVWSFHLLNFSIERLISILFFL